MRKFLDGKGGEVSALNGYIYAAGGDQDARGEIMFRIVKEAMLRMAADVNEIIHIPVGPDFLCWSRPYIHSYALLKTIHQQVIYYLIFINDAVDNQLKLCNMTLGLRFQIHTALFNFKRNYLQCA